LFNKKTPRRLKFLPLPNQKIFRAGLKLRIKNLFAIQKIYVIIREKVELGF